MLQQDLAAHEDQHDTAHQLCTGFIPHAEGMADFDADGGQDKGGAADKRDSGQDGYFQKGEGNAHRQCVMPLRL